MWNFKTLGRLRGTSAGAGEPAAPHGCAASPLSTCPRREPPGSRCTLPRGQIPPPSAASGPASRPPIYPRFPPFPGARTLGSPLLRQIMLATLPTGACSGLGPAWTAEAWRAAAVTRPRATRTSGGGAAARGKLGGRWWRRLRSWCRTSWVWTTRCAGIKARSWSKFGGCCARRQTCCPRHARPPAPWFFPRPPWTIWAT